MLSGSGPSSQGPWGGRAGGWRSPRALAPWRPSLGRRPAPSASQRRRRQTEPPRKQVEGAPRGQASLPALGEGVLAVLPAGATSQVQTHSLCVPASGLPKANAAVQQAGPVLGPTGRLRPHHSHLPVKAHLEQGLVGRQVTPDENPPTCPFPRGAGRRWPGCRQQQGAAAPAQRVRGRGCAWPSGQVFSGATIASVHLLSVNVGVCP